MFATVAIRWNGKSNDVGVERDGSIVECDD
jgi:hypothetical protein